MSRYLISAFSLVSLLLLSGCTGIQHAEEAKRFLESSPAPVEIRRPEPEEWRLENGLRVLFYRDDELPIVSGTLFVRGGNLFESEGEKGVIATMGQMQRLGGTKKLSPDELDEKLRELAAQVSSGFGGEYGTFSFNSLSSDVSEVFSIFRDVVLNPRFDEGRLDLFKTQALESIRRRKDDPVTIARMTADYLMYKKSVYGSVVESSDVKRLSRISLLRAHREYVRPDGAALVITGDVSRDEISKIVKQNFSRWAARGQLLPLPKAPPTPAPPGIYVIEGDYTQANLNAVQPGPDRHTPDRYGIRLLNNILGDGLDSRLMKSIRADLGLAYSVHGVVNPGYQKGKNVLYIQTKSESAYQALEKAFDEIELIQQETPGEEELHTMQLAAQGSFVFRFTSPAQVMERGVILEMLGYPVDYDQNYLENILAVNPENISEIASKWWGLKDFRIVVVGSSEAIAKLKAGVKNHPLLSQYPLRKMSFEEIPREIS